MVVIRNRFAARSMATGFSRSQLQYTLRQSRQIHLQHSPCLYGAAPDLQQSREHGKVGGGGSLFSSSRVVVICDGQVHTQPLLGGKGYQEA